MRFLRNLPIKRKLTIVTVLISGVALALACAAFAIYEQNLFRQQMARDFAILADMFDDNVAAGLAFDDPESIAKTLKAFDANAHIMAAAVYDHEGAIVAEYRRLGLPKNFRFLPVQGAGQHFTADRLDTFRDIVLAGEKIGVVYIGSDLDELRERVWRYVGIVGVLMLACSLVALTLASQLQKFISGPIVALAQTATAVAAGRNYHVRAVKQSDDELGRLIDAFNHMLEQIQSRDQALQRAHDELEQRVVERTSELGNSVSLLNATLDSTTDGILAADLSGRVVSYNTQFVSMWAVPVATLARRDRAAFVEHAATLMKDPETFRTSVHRSEYRAPWPPMEMLELADGRTFERYIHPQQLDGRTVGVVISFRDVTERRLAEERAAREHARFKRIFDAVPVGLTWMVRNDRASRIVNPAHAEITGVPVERCAEVELYRAHTHPEDRARQDELHRRLLAGEISHYEIEKRYLHADGAVRWASLMVIFHHDPSTGETQEINTLVDITERKRADARLAEASGLLEMMLQNSPDFIYFKDRESRFVRFSDSLCRRFNLSGEPSLRGRTDFDLFSIEHARPAYEDEQEIIRTGNSIIGKLEQETYADGRVSWALTTKLPWRDPSGAIVGTFGISKDVTELKDTEAKLAYERDLLRVLLEASPDSIYFKDRASRFVRVSRSETLRNLGHLAALQCGKIDPATAQLEPAPTDADYLIGLTDFDVYAGPDGRRAFEDEQTIIRTGEAMLGKVERMTVLDGSVRWNLTDKMPWRDGNGAIIGTFGVSKDITALKAAEEQLAQVHRQLLETSRQAGMAEVATGVLHNVGNVLNSVNVSTTLLTDQIRQSKMGHVAKLRDLLKANEENLAEFFNADPRGRQLPAFLEALARHLASEQAAMLAELESLRKNVEHIKDIVAMQQSYAKVSGVTETVALTELVEDALRMNSGAFVRHEVAVERDFQSRPVITTEKHKVLQILVNLMRNAKYACEESGRPDKRMTVRIVEESRRVTLSVIDNGVGIEPANLTRIFSHGFTTRKHGHGFGLHSGAIAARELGGSLTAHSDGLGCGATFTLELRGKTENEPDENARGAS